MTPAKTYTREQIEKAWPFSEAFLRAFLSELEDSHPPEPDFVEKYVDAFRRHQYSADGLEKGHAAQAQLVESLVDGKVKKLNDKLNKFIAQQPPQPLTLEEKSKLDEFLVVLRKTES